MKNTSRPSHPRQSESRHGQTAPDRRRVSYIEDIENFEIIEKTAKQMRVSTSTLMREAVQRFVKELVEKKGMIVFETNPDETSHLTTNATYNRKR